MNFRYVNRFDHKDRFNMFPMIPIFVVLPALKLGMASGNQFGKSINKLFSMLYCREIAIP